MGALAGDGDGRGFLCDVSEVRTDGQGPAGGHKVSPLQHQDQAALPAEPVQRDLHLGRTRRNVRLRVSTNAIKTVDHNGGLDAFPAEGQGRGAVAPRAGPEARDPEEEGGRGAGWRRRAKG